MYMVQKYVKKTMEECTRTSIDERTLTKFHRWLTDDEFAAEKEQALLAFWEQTGNTPTDSTLQSLEHLLDRKQEAEKRKIRRFTLGRYAAAVAVILSIGMWLWFERTASAETKWVEYFAQAGDSGSILLPDGSRVYANTGTVILYPETFGKNNRTLYITGEANFKVVKNTHWPFVVHSKGFSITALGTEFDVTSYPSDAYFKTTLIDGRVKVEWEEAPGEVLLMPSDQFVFYRPTRQFTVDKVDLYDATAWQRGELVFRGSTIREVLDVLEEKFAVSFQYPSLLFNDDKYNFRFKKDTSLPLILDIIKIVSGDFDYQEADKMYYLAPCKK